MISLETLLLKEGCYKKLSSRIGVISKMTARGETCNLALSLMEILCDLRFWQLKAKEKLRYYSFWGQIFFGKFPWAVNFCLTVCS